jgi:ribonuclease P/MRP protein subunit POP3
MTHFAFNGMLYPFSFVSHGSLYDARNRPSIPSNLQNAILAKIIQVLDGVSEYQQQRFMENRKRKRKDKASSNPLSSKRLKLGAEASVEPIHKDVPLAHPQMPQLDAPSVADPDRGTQASPSICRHIIYGINVVTKRLEEQTRMVRRPIIALVPDQPTENATPGAAAVRYVFVCRNDVDPTLILDHLPHLVAAYNSTRPLLYTILVLLPKGAELSLAQALGIRRVSVFGIDVGVHFFFSL